MTYRPSKHYCGSRWRIEPHQPPFALSSSGFLYAVVLSSRNGFRRLSARTVSSGWCSASIAIAAAISGDAESVGLQCFFDAISYGVVRDSCLGLDLPSLTVLAYSPFSDGFFRHGSFSFSHCQSYGFIGISFTKVRACLLWSSYFPTTRSPSAGSVSFSFLSVVLSS